MFLKKYKHQFRDKKRKYENYKVGRETNEILMDF